MGFPSGACLCAGRQGRSTLLRCPERYSSAAALDGRTRLTVLGSEAQHDTPGSLGSRVLQEPVPKSPVTIFSYFWSCFLLRGSFRNAMIMKQILLAVGNVVEYTSMLLRRSGRPSTPSSKSGRGSTIQVRTDFLPRWWLDVIGGGLPQFLQPGHSVELHRLHSLITHRLAGTGDLNTETKTGAFHGRPHRCP